jgi:hypothetical protein
LIEGLEHTPHPPFAKRALDAVSRRELRTDHELFWHACR